MLKNQSNVSIKVQLGEPMSLLKPHKNRLTYRSGDDSDWPSVSRVITCINGTLELSEWPGGIATSWRLFCRHLSWSLSSTVLFSFRRLLSLNEFPVGTFWVLRSFLPGQNALIQGKFQYIYIYIHMNNVLWSPALKSPLVDSVLFLLSSFSISDPIFIISPHLLHWGFIYFFFNKILKCLF